MTWNGDKKSWTGETVKLRNAIECKGFAWEGLKNDLES